jgi:hypothetical protein
MIIRVQNARGNLIKLSPQIASALDSLNTEAHKVNADWDDIVRKALGILEADGFNLAHLQPEVKYYDTKNGTKILTIKINNLV